MWKKSVVTSDPVKTCQDGIMCGRNVLGQTPVKDKWAWEVGPAVRAQC